jgi:hypothetical protein
VATEGDDTHKPVVAEARCRVTPSPSTKIFQPQNNLGVN